MGCISFLFLQPLADLLGLNEQTIEIDTPVILADAVMVLARQNPNKFGQIFFNKKGDLRPNVIFSLRGQTTINLKDNVRNGDKIILIPPVSGG